MLGPPEPAVAGARAAAITSTPYEVHADAEIPRSLTAVSALIPATVARHRANGPDRTITRLGGPSTQWIADYLLQLGVPFRVVAPDEVRRLVVDRLQQLLALQQNGPDPTVDGF